jgi:outer membrane receptor protein involved in Fe transport
VIRHATAGALCAVLTSTVLMAVASGRLQGTITRDGRGVGGVVVLVDELGVSTITDGRGGFSLADLPEGTYTVTLALGSNVLSERNVRVTAGQTTTFDRTVTWDVGFADAITVVSASRRRERIVDAPGAIATIAKSTIELGAPAGQLPALFAGTAGAELTQNGLYDYNLNTRGFNGFLTRRIQTIVDGRDPSIPGTSSQEWWTLDWLADDVESVELARGPSAALYGPNSFNGVLNIITKSPRDSQGLSARLSVGDLNTVKTAVRWAGGVGPGWFMRAEASHTRSDNFSVSRNERVEYAGLPMEVVALDSDRISLTSGSLRADRFYESGSSLVVEGGLTQGDGEVAMTSAGRAQQRDIARTWARASYFAPAWNVTGSFNRRTGDSLLLSAGAALIEKGTSGAIDGQWHRQTWHGRARVVAGASYARKILDSANDQGVQTLYSHRVTSDQGALFGQVDVDVAPDVKVVMAGRWDQSTLHPAQLSPKAAVVWTVRPSHTLRLGYNRAFQVANYTELFVDVPAAPPVDVSALEAAFAPVLGGQTLGFSSVPIFVKGNPTLDVEKIQAIEGGYSAVFGARTLVTLDYYYEWMKDFISGYLPGANPAYGPYRVPLALPPPYGDLIEATANAALPGLTNTADGRPQIVLSPGNSGKVNSQGLEASVDYFVGERWHFTGGYSWLNQKVVEVRPGAEVFLNAPSHRMSVGGTFTDGPASAQLSFRYQNAFDWSSGVFTGRVPAFGLVDLNGRYVMTPNWQLGLTVSNLLNHRHYEAFGADRLGRVALVHLTWSR